MTRREIFIEKPLWLGWKLCQYWPAEIILKHPRFKRGIYLKAPWYVTRDKTRWEAADETWAQETKVNPRNEQGFRLLSIREWPSARKYVRRFTYTTRYGAMQTATLTAYRERVREVYHWLRWFPFAGRDVDGLLIEFNEEMGSERDSWKGGVIGTSQTMLPGETVSQSIDRFLAEAQSTHRWDR
jgi:hypothetical protein